MVDYFTRWQCRNCGHWHPWVYNLKSVSDICRCPCNKFESKDNLIYLEERSKKLNG